MKDHNFNPESLMMTYGYKPELSEGAIKCPIFQTSTFVFKTAEEGKAFFELAYGLREKSEKEELGLIYSRINNPNLEILENRLCLWDKADDCAVFESGMSAISTVLLEFLKPGDLLVYSNPVYGGTDHFIHHFLDKIGVDTIGVMPNQSIEEVEQMIEASGKADKLSMIYLETPANPTNDIVDIEKFSQIAAKYSTEDRKALVAVDNTYMGPLWQHPLQCGADLVLYSATKYIGGHSDLIAGAVLGNAELMIRVKTLRTFLGNMVSPHTAWLLLRSLETLKVRMDQQTKNAQIVADYLDKHPKVEKVYYLGLLKEGTEAHSIYTKQCSAPGAMVSFDIIGGENEAFMFLNNLKLMKLAVSLGGTESLSEHPKTMTHAGVNEEQQQQMNITDQLVRLSIGVESAKDLIWDLEQALEKVDIANALEVETV
ncbi:cystathionine gamma-synthase family protein [Aquimarina sp. MMG015]|uniref:cystathionine gamma-synthase family protein n=1 Tax=unclassified Aquimarina TaxID=2627091 RepID=UPI000E52406B|nr:MULTISPECIES: cystathionine gamma-synthase family protein [unclassified Aquimarina]AXT54866.1 cystathionine gamma-synthase family protein [Aquimarina sp. AD1]MBQ4804720.1 cystathionine gamma-synthase family protein [Aquimarina sp. MMG015]RKN07446.1 cystathionine gamma-synthase family protein [Aquimarina sp. AD1]